MPTDNFPLCFTFYFNDASEIEEIDKLNIMKSNNKIVINFNPNKRLCIIK